VADSRNNQQSHYVAKGRVFDVSGKVTRRPQLRDRIKEPPKDLIMLGLIRKVDDSSDVVSKIIGEVPLKTEVSKTNATWTREAVAALQQH
jgi:hypothetical protein